MSTNEQLIKKADWALADLAADGGLLNPEQADTFIRKLLVQPTVLRQARAVTMNSPQMKINKIQFGSRILRKATQGVALDDLGPNTARSKPTTEQIQLNSKEVIAEVRLPYDIIEDNIERGNIGQRTDTSTGGATGGIKDTIMTLIAERAALDLEELALLGDTAHPTDTYLGLVDGFLVQATDNEVDLQGADISKEMFKAGLQAMPDQYLRNRAAMKHWVSVDNEVEYRDSLANRETALGDAQIQGTSPVFGFGVPVEAASLMPSDKGLFTFPQNLVFGIQRRIHVEVDKDIKTREYIIVLTARVDFLIEETLAVVKYTNIGS